MKFNPDLSKHCASAFEDIMNISKAEAKQFVEEFDDEPTLCAAVAILLFIGGDTESERAFAVRKRLLEDNESLRKNWSDGN